MAEAKKTEAAKVETKTARELELEKKLAEAEAAKIKAEKEAVAKVCEAVGLDPQSLEGMNKAKETEPMLEFDIGTQVVSINGFDFSGRGKAPASVVENIIALAGAARMRKLREKIGNDYEVEMLASGGVRSRLIKQSEESLV